MAKIPPVNALILCLSILFSVQTHGAGKWREKISRHLPWSAAFKVKKLEQKEKQHREQLIKKVNSMNNHQLAVLDLELKSTYDIKTVEEMKELAREEVYARIVQDEQGEILQVVNLSLKERLGSILNNPATASRFFETLQDVAKGNPPGVYRNILKEFFFANVREIMALEPGPEEMGILNQAIYSIDVSIRILQETLDRAESADTFLAAFDASTILAPNKRYQKSLQNFFAANKEKLEKLLSAEQAEVMDFTIDKIAALDAGEKIIKDPSEISNAENVWRYIQKTIEMEPGPEQKRDGAKLLINFLKTWPQYLEFKQYGDNLLHKLAYRGNRATSRQIGAFLLEAGLELEAKNKEGLTALFIIGERDITSPLFDYLKEQGANLHATNSLGSTILHRLVYNQDLPPSPEIEKAIGLGLSPYQKNSKGFSPIDFSTYGHNKNYSREYGYRDEKMKMFWQQYIEENNDIPIDDSLRLPPVVEKEEVPTKMSRCLQLVAGVFK